MKKSTVMSTYEDAVKPNTSSVNPKTNWKGWKRRERSGRGKEGDWNETLVNLILGAGVMAQWVEHLP